MSRVPAVSLALLTALLTPLLTPSVAFAAGGISLVPEIEVLALNFVVLGLLIYPVNRILIQPLIALLAEREARSEGANARAAELGDESSDLEGTLSERLAGARAAAQARRAEILSGAQTEERRLLEDARSAAASEVESVRSSIAADSESARSALESDARQLAREAAASILGRAL